MSASVEISEHHFRVTDLPIVKESLTGEMAVVSAEGEVKFDGAYGAENAPCVLLFFSGISEVIPLFITEKKKHLIYSVSLNRDQEIIFGAVPNPSAR